MRRFNLLEIVGLTAIILPTAVATAIGVLLATGTIRIYRESSKREESPAVTS